MGQVAEHWIPVRFIWQAQVCDFCWKVIPRAAPGKRVGERGTKAWFSKDRQVYECLDCRNEAYRAETQGAA